MSFSKRCLDILVSFLILAFCSPILCLVALLVRVLLGSPVLFVQTRPGYKGKPFSIYKFRTMRNVHDAQARELSDEQRMTRFGGILRSLSLDELPELINILRGEMSLVGPRPLLMEYLERYTPEQMRRHDVRPGITGWAQINGRNALSWPDRFKLDLWYVDHWSFWLDLKILFQTFSKVVRREGISADGYVTMPAFMGSQRQR